MWKLFYSLVNNTTIQTQGDKDVEIILQFGKQYYHPNTGRHIYTGAGDKDVEIILQFGKQYYHPNTGRHIYTGAGDKDVEIVLQFGKQYYHPNTGRQRCGNYSTVW